MLSIILPTLNENNLILEKTIESIFKNSPSNIEIIVIDDNSNTEPQFKNKNKIIFHRNKIRLGAAQSKHYGVCLSTKKYIFLTDSHVLFDHNYYDNVLKSLENRPNSLYCGVCLGLSEDRFDLARYNGAYYGARLFLYEDNQFLDGKWTHANPEDDYEISCVMGANYFMHKSHFFKIRGYADLRAWGSEEPCLSIKTWLSGGEVRLNKNVKIGHMFRNNAPYTTNIKEIIYNKIRLAQTLLPEDLARILISKLNQDISYFSARQIIRKEDNIIKEFKKYYSSIFNKDIYWLCHKFNIAIPQ